MFNGAKCNSGRVKLKIMLASSLSCDHLQPKGPCRTYMYRFKALSGGSSILLAWLFLCDVPWLDFAPGPSLAPLRWVLVSIKILLSSETTQCDSAWWWQLTALSWLPSTLAGSLSQSFRHHPSHSSIGDEFNIHLINANDALKCTFFNNHFFNSISNILYFSQDKTAISNN